MRIGSPRRLTYLLPVCLASFVGTGMPWASAWEAPASDSSSLVRSAAVPDPFVQEPLREPGGLSPYPPPHTTRLL